MDLKEIEKWPEFESDIDPLTLSRLSETDRPLANSLSKQRREISYYSERLRESYNQTVRNALFIKKYGGWLVAISAIGSAAGTALILKMVEKIHF